MKEAAVKLDASLKLRKVPIAEYQAQSDLHVYCLLFFFAVV